MTRAKPGQTPLRHIPKRTCIACRRTGAKRGLVRLVCTNDTGVEIDLTGKKSGRGAYLCPERSCWENALKTGRIEYALRTSLTPENKERLVIYAKGFDNTNSSGEGER